MEHQSDKKTLKGQINIPTNHNTQIIIMGFFILSLGFIWITSTMSEGEIPTKNIESPSGVFEVVSAKGVYDMTGQWNAAYAESQTAAKETVIDSAVSNKNFWHLYSMQPGEFTLMATAQNPRELPEVEIKKNGATYKVALNEEGGKIINNCKGIEYVAFYVLTKGTYDFYPVGAFSPGEEILLKNTPKNMKGKTFLVTVYAKG
ncbi:MAG: hypothetical protein WC178_00550 [Candidatus Paceibacterota bacterium]